jgi:concentrative nucleoside transporter, CNT family
MCTAWWGRFLNLDGAYDLTLELIFGYLFYPIAFLLGVSREGNDLLLVGRLIGVKLVVVRFDPSQGVPRFSS